MQGEWVGMLMDDLGTPARDADDLDGVAAAVMLHAARPADDLPRLDGAGLAALPGRALEHLRRLRKAGRWTECDDIETMLGKLSAVADARVRGRRSTRSGGSTPSSAPRAFTSGRAAGTSSISPVRSPAPA